MFCRNWEIPHQSIYVCSTHTYIRKKYEWYLGNKTCRGQSPEQTLSWSKHPTYLVTGCVLKMLGGSSSLFLWAFDLGIFLSFLACYDDQQRDWRFHNEVYAAQARAQFTRKWLIQQKLKCAAPYRLLTSDLLSCNTHDQMIMDHTIKHMRELYHPIGANPDFESVPWTFYLFGYNNYPAFARFQYNQ